MATSKKLSVGGEVAVVIGSQLRLSCGSSLLTIHPDNRLKDKWPDWAALVCSVCTVLRVSLASNIVIRDSWTPDGQ